MLSGQREIPVVFLERRMEKYRLRRKDTVETIKEPRTFEAPAIGAYTDYRHYLRDFYEYKRQLSRKDLRPYSYATFAAGADIKSPNYLKLIIDGQRNLSREMAVKFSKALALSKEELEEFLALVDFTQATEPLERNRFLKVLADLRVRQQLKAGEINAETWPRCLRGSPGCFMP